MIETVVATCPHCGASVPQEFQFCGRCGRPLRGSVSGSRGSDPSDSRTDRPPAERRQITVMFCDLVGSVRLSHLLDPEDFAAVVRRVQEVVVEGVEARGGYVAQYLGDGILAYFGYPTAGERVAEQAVRAGLEVLARMTSLSAEMEEQRGLPLRLRIGMHTGLVVVEAMGSGAHRERLALGETPNLAARLQAAAPTGTLVVSRETYRLIEGAFRCVDLGAHELKGSARPQHVYQVLEERYDEGLLAGEEADGPLSTVGRENDIARLLLDWSEAAGGAGRSAVVVGEAGVGKTHLVRHVCASVRGDAHYAVVCRCAPNQESTPFHPLVDWLSGVLNFYPDQPAADRMEMIRFVARQHGLMDEDVVPLLGALLTESSTAASGVGYSASRAHARIHAVLEDLFGSLAADRPLLFVVEDVQWIDPSTRDFLLYFAERIPTQRVYLLLTSRLDLTFDLPDSCPLTRVDLARLSGEQIEAVIVRTADGRHLPHAVVEHIREKAEGIPLYAQEFTKMVIDSGLLEELADECRLRSGMPELAIPATLRDSLMARLDRLMPVKEVAQVCSLLGRSFTFDLLEAAMPDRKGTLQPALDELVEAQLLEREVAPGGERYVFRHALLREAAYESMLKSSRIRFHRRLARYLIGRADSHPVRMETVAYHLTEAGEAEEAATYWCKAGHEAQQRWANEEAVDYFTRGLGLVGDAPESDALRRTVFDLYVGVAGAYLQRKGYTHPDVGAAFERAAGLAPSLDAAASIPAMMGLWSHCTVLGNHARAEVLAERMTKLAQMAPKSLSTFSALSTRAHTWFWQGDIGAARTLLESLLDRFAQVKSSTPPGLSFQHPRIGCLSYLSLIHWVQGRPDRASDVGRVAVHAAEEIGHPFSLAFACGFNSVLNVYMERVDAVRQMADRTVEVADRYGFPFWANVGRVIRSWADAEDDLEGAVTGMRHGLQALKEAGVQIWTAYPTALMAELLGRLARTEEAVNEFDAVLSECELRGEYYFVPEVRRMRARLLDGLDLKEQAAQERALALEMARRQTACALSLRILNDMARYDATPPPKLEVLLKSTVNAFEVGSEAPDILQAHAHLRAARQFPPSTSGGA